MAEENVPLPESTSTVPTAQLLDTNSQEHPPPTFALFPKLPAELRIEIWRLSIPYNRVVGIKNSGRAIDPPGSSIDENWHTTGRWCLQTSSTDTIPAILHTNRESRAEGLKLYSLILETRLFRPHYFNFSRDTFVLLGYNVWEFDHVPSYDPNNGEELQKFLTQLRHLIILHPARKNDFDELDLHAVRDIRNLKTLVLAKLKADKGINHENAIRKWLHELWNSKTPIFRKRNPNGIQTEENWRDQDRGEHNLISRWWESVDVTITNGGTIEAPSDMATEVVFMDEEEIETMLGRPLPVLESRDG